MPFPCSLALLKACLAKQYYERLGHRHARPVGNWREEEIGEKKTCRRYTAEFKAAAVAWLGEPGGMLGSIAQALVVAATQVKTGRLEQQTAGSAEAVTRRRAEAQKLLPAPSRGRCWDG
jgi:transposase-like protein